MKWDTKPLSNFCSLVNGKAFKSDDWSESGLPIIRIQNLNDSTKPFNYWSGALDKQVHIKKGDLLFAWSGTPGTSFGAHMWSGPEGVLNQHIFRIDVENNKVTKDWLKFCLNYQLLNLIDQAHGGVGLKHVTKGAVESILIPLPTLAEQKRIAGILDAADDLRAKRRESLAQLDTLLQSTFLDMFGDPVTNPKGWVQEPLTDAVELINGRAFKSSEWSEKGLPIIRIQNVKNIEESYNRYEGYYDKKHLVKNGDILFCWAGQLVSIGVYQWNREDGLLNQHIFKVIPRFKGEPSFVTYMLGTIIEKAKLSFRGIEMKHLTKADLSRQMITIPPLELQHRFATIVESIEKQKSQLRSHLAELDTLFASLQSRAFNGEL